MLSSKRNHYFGLDYVPDDPSSMARFIISLLANTKGCPSLFRLVARGLEFVDDLEDDVEACAGCCQVLLAQEIVRS